GTIVSRSQIGGISLTSGQNGVNYVFGLCVPGALSGYVYTDFDRDGTRNTNVDTAVSGVTLTLLETDAAGAGFTETVTTDANGYYILGNLAAGTYTITMTPPGGVLHPEVANVGTVNTVTIGTASSTTKITGIAVPLGTTGLNYDFGLTFP